MAARKLDRSARLSRIQILPDLPVCQTDLPLDWYQDEFKSYAEEYLALPDRLPGTVLPWMEGYLGPALKAFGPRMLLLAHYYMGGEIVKLVEHFGGRIADSYELALKAQEHAEVECFVESAVHFMAEAIATLAAPGQQVYITNPRSGCTMEMFAKEDHIAPAFDELQQYYGDDLMVIAYMNTSGRVKALAGKTGGAVCTSSNARLVMDWALKQGRKILFVPDQHLGAVVCYQCDVPPELQFLWGAGVEGARQKVSSLDALQRRRLDASRVILWGSSCGVHTVFDPAMVEYWRAHGYRVLVHPESPLSVVQAADGFGSTKYLWNAMLEARPGDKLAIATEGHFVRNAREQARPRGVEVVHLADIPGGRSIGCGCATMSRNDPPHLVALVDLLYKGKAPDLNRVEVGDVVDEITGHRERLGRVEQDDVREGARQSLQRMVDITEMARA